jgi:hypothetical protein
MSKFGFALIAIAVISVAVAIQAYNIQAADAQAKLPNNSVTTQTIVNGQVQTDDLANGAVTTAKIADGTIQEQDIADGVIPDGGGAIQLNVHRVESEEFHVPSGFNSWEVDCPSGEIVTGGGHESAVIHVLSSFPLDENTWRVDASPNFGDPNVVAILKVFALCVDPTIP